MSGVVRCFSRRHPSTRVSEAESCTPKPYKRADWPGLDGQARQVAGLRSEGDRFEPAGAKPPLGAQPFGGGRSGEGGRHKRPELRPEDIPDRPVSLRRVARLFRPYRLRLGTLLALIFLGSILSVASPFLLREAVDTGSSSATHIAVLAGRRHDRPRRHQRRAQRRADLDLQPGRPARDARPARGRLCPPAANVPRLLHTHTIGRGAGADRLRHRRDRRCRHEHSHLDGVHRRHRRCHRRRDVRPRMATDTFSLGLLPFFVWLTRRVGNERRRIQSVRQGRLADMSTLVEESLSVSGILLGKTMGRSPSSSTDSRPSPANWPIRGPSAHGRALADGIRADDVRDHARAVYLFAGETTHGGRDLDRHGRGLHALQMRMLFPRRQLLSEGARSADLAGAVRADLRVSRPADRHPERPQANTFDCLRGDVTLERRVVPLCPRLPLDARRREREIPAGTRTALVGETGSGKTTLAYLVARLYEPQRGRVASTETTSAT